MESLHPKRQRTANHFAQRKQPICKPVSQVHTFLQSFDIAAMDEEPNQREQESLSMCSRGLNSNDVFNNKDRIVQFRENITQELLRNEGFQMTSRGIPFRKVEVQGKATGYEYLNRNGNTLQSARTGADFLSQAFRTIALETRDIISDLIQLQKMIKTKEFQDIHTVIPS